MRDCLKKRGIFWKSKDMSYFSARFWRKRNNNDKTYIKSATHPKSLIITSLEYNIYIITFYIYTHTRARARARTHIYISLVIT